LAATNQSLPPKCAAPSEEIKKKTGHKHFECVPVYYHHLAVLITDKRKEARADESCVLENYVTAMDQSQLRDTIQLLSLLRRIHETSNEYKCTALLQRALDRFFFPDEMGTQTAALLGQYPVLQVRRSDGSIYSLKDGWPTQDILHYDFKPKNFEDAVAESICYFISAHQGENDEYALAFGLPCTYSEISFRLYMSGNAKAYSIELASVNIYDEKVLLEKFLSLVYASVHYLIDNPVAVRQSPFACEPIRGIELRDNFSHHPSNRVFLKDGMVYKIYEKGDVKQHNADLMRNLGYFENLNLELVGKNHFLLSYTMLQGNTKPRFDVEIASALHQIGELHKQGLVHGDIREGNILFYKASAFLIDFDFTGKRGTFYSDSYNSTIQERHRTASGGSAKEFVHDYYALGIIAETNGLADTFVSSNKCLCQNCTVD
jgi:hypothetical protein